MIFFLLFMVIIQLVKSNVQPQPRPDKEWINQGGYIQNTGSALNRILNANNLDLQTPFFKLNVGSSVSGTLVTDGVYVYGTTAQGKVFAVNPSTKTILWQKDIFADYYKSVLPNNRVKLPIISVTTPSLTEGDIIIGIKGPADILLIDKKTGNLKKKKTLNEHPTAIIEQSGTVYKGIYFVGVSSIEELVANDDDYTCCSFSGTFHALNIGTWEFVWKTFRVIPDTLIGASSYYGPRGWSGGKIWTSSPAINSRKGIVYFTTGDAYTSPVPFEDCINTELASDNPDVEGQCFQPLAPGVKTGSLIGLSISTGNTIIQKRIISRNSFNLTCKEEGGFFPDNPFCETVPPGAQASFDASPIVDHAYFCGNCDEDVPSTTLISRFTSGFCYNPNTNKYQKTTTCLRMAHKDPNWIGPYDLKYREMDPNTEAVIYLRQSNGYQHAIRESTLETIWINAIGPGGTISAESEIRGGMAIDNEHLYSGIINPNHRNWYLKGGNHTKCGGVSSICKYTGNLNWTFINPACDDITGGPDKDTDESETNGRAYSSNVFGSILAINGGIIFGSSDSTLSEGVPVSTSEIRLYLLNDTDGTIITKGETKASIVGGFGASSRCVFVGQGYGSGNSSHFPEGQEILGFCASPSS